MHAGIAGVVYHDPHPVLYHRCSISMHPRIFACVHFFKSLESFLSELFNSFHISSNCSLDFLLHTFSTTSFLLHRRRKTLSNRGRWSPLSLFRQVHLGIGKSENNLPSQGYELLQPGMQ